MYIDAYTYFIRSPLRYQVRRYYHTASGHLYVYYSIERDMDVLRLIHISKCIYMYISTLHLPWTPLRYQVRRYYHTASGHLYV